MIHFDDFSFSYHGNINSTLSHINLEINKGEWIVLAGPSGCGKSTFALALSGFLFQQDYGNHIGNITFNGQSISTAPLFDMADHINLVQQNPENQFCTLNIQDELAFGLENRCMSPDEIHSRIDWALDIVNGSHLLNKDLASLSGGEKQKIGIASMLAAKPSVLILDEPTSNLDRFSTDNLFKVLDVLRKQEEITIIIIEHKLQQLLPYHPRIFWMEKGKIEESNLLNSNNYAVTESESNNFHRILPENYKLLLEVNNLNIGYAQDNILNDITFSVSEGEFISLIGMNGSGKTTLLLSLMGLLSPLQGTIFFRNQDISTLKVKEIAENMGIVFQNPDHQLFTESVLNEATFAPKNFSIPPSKYEENVNDLLDVCNLRASLKVHPQKLSYGEKRRLNLISILSYSPKVILLDEILIGQDRNNAHFLLELLKNHTRTGGSVILAHHQPEIVNCYSTRTILLKDGRIALDCPQDQAKFELAKYDPHFLPVESVEVVPC
ncbi:MAG: energy-coupling factor ABC transporter ATP-binding protein [Anaerolineaceae bacterium]|nr:energy-coupling factor ABC transporter ATP-binding protein [Anaerolineaceae bacterium]